MFSISKWKKTTVAIVAVSAASAMILTGCAQDATSPTEPAADLSVVVALAKPLKSLDVLGATSQDYSTLTATQHMFDPLVRVGSNGEIQPALAESWDQADELTWTFHLRAAKFHNGDDVTAADVKASLEKLVSDKGPSASQWSQLESVTADDAATVTITTKKPVGPLLANLSFVMIAPASLLSSPTFWEQPVGSGPFEFVSYEAGQSLKLKAFEGYWGGEATIAELEFQWIPDVSGRMTALKNGAVDLAYLIPADSVSSVKAMDGITYETVQGFSYDFVWINQQAAPFNDVKVRQALWHALDLQSLVDNLYTGLAEVALAPIAPGVFGYEAQKPYSYDPGLAKQMLADAGYPNGIKGNIEVDGSNQSYVALAQAMASDWAKVGADITVEAKEPAKYLEDFTGLNWNIHLHGNNSTLTGDADFTLGRLYLCEPQRQGFCDPDLEAALQAAKVTTDQKERAKLYSKAIGIIWDNAYGIFPMSFLDNYAYDAKLDGFVPPQNGLPYLFMAKKS